VCVCVCVCVCISNHMSKCGVVHLHQRSFVCVFLASLHMFHVYVLTGSQPTPTACPASLNCSVSAAVPSVCIPGYFCAASLPSATLCPAGAYCPLASATFVPCPAGSFNSKMGQSAQSDCLVCLVGGYCPAGSSAVNPCAAGAYNPSAGKSVCLPCPSNFACAVAGLSAASPCLRGLYSFTGMTVCLTCPSPDVRVSCDSNSSAVRHADNITIGSNALGTKCVSYTANASLFMTTVSLQSRNSTQTFFWSAGASWNDGNFNDHQFPDRFQFVVTFPVDARTMRICVTRTDCNGCVWGQVVSLPMTYEAISDQTTSAVHYLALVTDASNTGTSQQTTQTNGAVSYTTISGKPTAYFNNSLSNYLSVPYTPLQAVTLAAWLYSSSDVYWTALSITNALRNPTVQVCVCVRERDRERQRKT
jgi:hypothetical protein